jgi:hypothetical protein
MELDGVLFLYIAEHLVFRALLTLLMRSSQKKSFLHTHYEAFTAVGMKLQMREVDVLLRCDGTQGHGEDVEAQTKQSDGVEKYIRLEMERSNQLVKGKPILSSIDFNIYTKFDRATNHYKTPLIFPSTH